MSDVLKIDVRSHPYVFDFARRISRACITNARLSIGLFGKVPSDGFTLTRQREVSRPMHKEFTLDFDYYGNLATEDHDERIVLPFYLHPEAYVRGGASDSSLRLARDRPIGVFFGGTFGSDSYNRDFSSTIPNRTEVLQTVTSRLAERLTLVEKRSSAEALLRKSSDVLLVTTPSSTNSLGKHLLAPRDYMRVMQHSRFAIAPPGVTIPHSHNLVEAMSAGTIPITCYGELFEPPLIDRDTCLAFHSIDELVEKVNEALAMDLCEIQEMSDRVYRYYASYLEPRSVGGRLVSAPGSALQLLCCASTVTRFPRGTGRQGQFDS